MIVFLIGKDKLPDFSDSDIFYIGGNINGEKEFTEQPEGGEVEGDGAGAFPLCSGTEPVALYQGIEVGGYSLFAGGIAILDRRMVWHPVPLFGRSKHSFLVKCPPFCRGFGDRAGILRPKLVCGAGDGIRTHDVLLGKQDPKTPIF